MITDEVLKKFKDRMKITNKAEDDNLKELLSSSYASIKAVCGSFDLDGETDIDKRGRELVFERSRYAYNDALEYFDDNFLSRVNSLALDNLADEGDSNA